MPGVRQPAQRLPHLGGQLPRVVRVNADEQRVILPEHRAQLRRDALRQEDGYPRADPQKLHVRDGAQPAQQMVQLLVAEQQRVAAAQQYVAHFRMCRRTYSICRSNSGWKS